MSLASDALLTPGPRPDVHWAAVRKLAGEWPALWSALFADMTGDQQTRTLAATGLKAPRPYMQRA